MSIKLIHEQYTGKWSFKSEGELIPNCLCDFASGSKTFPTSFLALRFANEVDVEIANRGQYPS